MVIVFTIVILTTIYLISSNYKKKAHYNLCYIANFISTIRAEIELLTKDINNNTSFELELNLKPDFVTIQFRTNLNLRFSSIIDIKKKKVKYLNTINSILKMVRIIEHENFYKN